jgi:tetratricopeptide (TPR) repeat protein
MPLPLVALLVAAAPLTAADLSPLLAEGAAAEGKVAFDAGRYGEAAQKLAKSPLPGAAFLRALALLQAGRPAEALRAAEGLDEKLPEIADRIAYLRAEALEAAGRPRDALSAWAAVPDGSLRAWEARLARAKLAASLGDRQGALAGLTPLLALRPPADLAKPDFGASALRFAGRLSTEEGDPAFARKALLDCWAGHPLAPEAPDCRVALGALPAPHGAVPSQEDVLRRAEALLDANRNESALALLEPLLAQVPPATPSETFSCRVRAAAGRGLRKERSYQRAIDVLRPVADACGDRGPRAGALRSRERARRSPATATRPSSSTGGSSATTRATRSRTTRSSSRRTCSSAPGERARRARRSWGSSASTSAATTGTRRGSASPGSRAARATSTAPSRSSSGSRRESAISIRTSTPAPRTGARGSSPAAVTPASARRWRSGRTS